MILPLKIVKEDRASTGPVMPDENTTTVNASDSIPTTMQTDKAFVKEAGELEWMDRWTTIPNETNAYPKIKTSFRLDDYRAYQRNPDYSVDTSNQNRLLPIYCSIMGLIIISLLLYVVYKLWKQREAVRKGKLSDDVYTTATTTTTNSSSCHKVKQMSSCHQQSGVVGSMKHHIIDSLHAYSAQLQGRHQVDGGTVNNQSQHHHQQQDQQSKQQNAPCLGYSQDREPLLLISSKCEATTEGSTDPLLSTLSVKAFGSICYKLAQSGWLETIENLGFDATTLENNYSILDSSSTYDTLLTATKFAKGQNDVDQVSDTSLAQRVLLLDQVFFHEHTTLNQLGQALTSSNRSDLTGYLQLDQVTKHKPNQAVDNYAA